MNKNLKFVIWILAVTLFSATIGSMLPSKPWPPEPKSAAVSHKASSTVVSQTGPGNAASPSVSSPAPQSPPGKNTSIKKGAPVSATYSELKEILEKDPSSVFRVVFRNGSAEVVVNRSSQADLKVIVPDDGGKAELRRMLDASKIAYEVKSDEAGGWSYWQIGMVVGVFVLGLLIFTHFSKLRTAAAARGLGGPSTGNPSNMGKTTAKMVDEIKESVEKVTFDDVAGADEAVKELKRVVKGFSNSIVYDAFDAKLPRGILLLGPPGTGKTLLAKAVAGECDGSMQILSGSDFVEMYVGVGAARVRDTFEKARAKVKETGKPSVIFIDEIDAVGGKRGSGANGGGGNQEREQTLNAMLVEMDGVNSNKGIIVIAATNRADMLDDALLRPGRFDYHISVDLPDIAGREKIFGIHTRKKPLAANVSPGLLAVRTYGYSGAEIKGACDRAATLAADRWALLPGVAEVLAQLAEADKLSKQGEAERATNGRKAEALLKQAESMKTVAEAALGALPKKEILLTDFDEGIDFVKYGGPKTSSQAAMAEEEKENTAYHEAGHGVVAARLKAADPVVKATIMRRSRALGYVQYMPTSDRVSFTMEQAVTRIITAMAGRAAQEVYLNRVDTGASNDFEQACDMAHRMVTKWGMSRLGRISVGDRGASPLAGMSGGGSMSYGGVLSNEIDAEWRRIVEDCYQIARHIVETDKERMEYVAKTLLAQETILQPEWQDMLQKLPSKVVDDKVDYDPRAR